MSHETFDQAALEQLYVQLERSLYNVVFRWVWNAEEAHDIVQETFVRLWDRRQGIQPETVRPLAYKIGINLAKKRRRWLSIRTFFWLDDQTHADTLDSAETRLLGEESALRIRACVDSLPEKQREVVMLCHYSELSYAEVARLVGVPEGTVASRKNTAMRSLRAALEAHDG